ncbi:hypothetical protein [Blastococcus sp. SYSU D00695]
MTDRGVHVTAERPGAPDLLPVLGRGNHRDARHGACFMEYTSLLAGEPFSDRPACVDGDLADVLRGANDKLSDADRPLLVPLLGRAIGLVVDPPPPRTRWWRRGAHRYHRETVVPHLERTARARREVTQRFLAALAPCPSPAGRGRHGRPGELGRLFWDAMDEPAPASTSRQYVARLVERLYLLHECYEQVLGDGIGARAPDGPVASGGRGAPVGC